MGDIHNGLCVAVAVHNTVRANRIIPRKSVFFCNLLTVKTRFSNRNRNDNIIGALQRFAAVRSCFDLCFKTVLLDQFSGKISGQVQSFFVDVHQRDSTVSEFGIQQNIRNNSL